MTLAAPCTANQGTFLLKHVSSDVGYIYNDPWWQCLMTLSRPLQGPQSSSLYKDTTSVLQIWSVMTPTCLSRWTLQAQIRYIAPSYFSSFRHSLFLFLHKSYKTHSSLPWNQYLILKNTAVTGSKKKRRGRGKLLGKTRLKDRVGVELCLAWHKTQVQAFTVGLASSLHGCKALRGRMQSLLWQEEPSLRFHLTLFAWLTLLLDRIRQAIGNSVPWLTSLETIKGGKREIWVLGLISLLVTNPMVKEY